MSTDQLRVSTVVPVAPPVIYDAWLDARAHSAFTGGAATVEAVLFGRHTAWDGYIDGVNLELDRGRRIVQTWRTSEFPVTSPDSRLEVLFEPTVGGTRLTLIHTDIPAGQGPRYEQGWKDHYFKPMLAYFRGAKVGGGRAKAAPKSRPAKRPKAKAGVRARVKVKAKAKVKVNAKAKAKAKASARRPATKAKRAARSTSGRKGTKKRR